MDGVREADLLTAEELGLTVDRQKPLGELQLVISGHTDRLGYIRIHIEQLEPDLSLVGVSARTAIHPLTSAWIETEFALTYSRAHQTAVRDQPIGGGL